MVERKYKIDLQKNRLLKVVKSILKYTWILIAFALLTVLTQIGGLIYLVSIFLVRQFKWIGQLKLVAIFACLYLFCTLIIIPPIAKVMGRQALPITGKGLVIPNHIWTCLLNRHYVKPKMYTLVHDSARALNKNKDSNFKLRYLDANFPFFDGFPLLPHRSHDDGKKLDLAFMYIDRVTHNRWNDSVSFLGYGFCEVPLKGEVNSPANCAKQGYWQYSLLTKAFGLGSHKEIQFDEFASAALIQTLNRHPNTKKIFIEPHLKHRLGFSNDPKVRFHGCAAVRHDDHIHLEL